MIKTYIQLKDGPEYKKGAIFQGEIDNENGKFIDPPFYCLNQECAMLDISRRYFLHYKTILQEDWFEEVSSIFLNKEDMKKVKNMIKKENKLLF